MSLYPRLRTTATRLLTTYAQGTVQTVTYTETGGDEFTPPTMTPVPVQVQAIVSGVSQRWVDGVNILMSDLVVTMTADVSVSVGGIIRIDGEDHQVKRVMPVPAAGEPVIVKAVVG